jgi:hypothetical protein
MPRDLCIYDYAHDYVSYVDVILIVYVSFIHAFVRMYVQTRKPAWMQTDCCIQRHK